ncbi:hypothetical protein AQUCO_00700938v1 [Aquilegia coerulea]|uniref:ABC transporter domain-containing protein n=1 Tax=Aquilegia coerulea TaxID=218851 RepID=A0A2G5EMG6_AQUCA|nr:hypothetical protein AQUCO_00700938v1 [Aquilegia coerulea]
MEGSERMRTSTRSRSKRWGMEDMLSSRWRGSRIVVLNEDEEALRVAALEKLPTYDRLRTSVITSSLEDNENHQRTTTTKEVDVRHLHKNERTDFIERVFHVADEDNEKFLKRLKDRIDRVGIQLPAVEVRFEHLTVEADCKSGNGALPTLLNSAIYILERIFGFFGIKLAKEQKMTILKDVSGVIKPPRMALLLGPPSSGKTTLLLALAAELNYTLKVKGEVTYNGHKLNEFVPQKTSVYISENDIHIPEMSVKETLDFSARCQGVGAKYDLLTELSRREKAAGILPDAEVDLFMKATAVGGFGSSLQTDYTLKILGLDICKDTIVGDQMRRGISGGQRKRVTTGEMIVGPTKTLFMDEISTGLDSSTTYQIVKCLQQIVHLTECTFMISLLQPAPETYDLFDDVVLISEGQIVYQGPRENVLEFFESCGFQCPERKGTADFLQEITSRNDQEQYWADKSKPYKYMSVSEFADRFKTFHIGLQLYSSLLIPYDKSKSHKAALVCTKHSVSVMDLLKTNFAKEWLLMKRNYFVYIFKTGKIIVMAFLLSTIFLRTNLHARNEADALIYNGALTFTVITNMFNGSAEITITILRLPVFYKHRDLLFHPAWTFTLPNFLLRIPIAIIETLVWMVLTYYSIGFSPEATRFFKQFLLIFLLQLTADGLFKFIAGVCRTQTISSTGGALILLFMNLLGGFSIHRDRIPPWWIWGYWCSPLSYAYSAITVNELLAPRWMNKMDTNNVTSLGVSVLRTIGVSPKKNIFWIGAGALVGFTIIFQVLFTLSLMYLDRDVEIQRNGSRSNASGLGGNADPDLEAAREASAEKRMALPFTPLAMSFKNMSYSVDMPPEMKAQGVAVNKLRLLNEVSGAFRPGVLTALMGVSGAGKTTLMDVLAGRKTGGYIEGDIKISGFPKKQATFARVSGYCEQNDIHSPQVTVKESLIYSASLRLPKEVSNEEKMVFVEDVLELIELDNLKDALVGLPGTTGLSTEQRKRLTIAVELIANPSIIFMDEPTSGLDARAASIVMRAVRNTVDTGRTVVCTIHQPSIDIFEAFDELLLMKRGGHVIYFGPLGHHSQDLINYFEAIPDVPKIKDKYNPATWMLEVSSTAAESQLGVDLAEYYKSSPLYERNKDLVEELSTPAPGARDLQFPTQYSQTMWVQFRSCFWKQWLTYWRSPDYNLVRFYFSMAAAFMIGTVFWRIGAKRDTSTELQTVLGAMTAAVIFIGVNNSGTVQPVVVIERTVFYREKAAGMYSGLPYAIAQVVAEIPYVFIQTTYYSVLVYAMMSFQWTVAKFFWFFFISFFTFLYFTYYGMMTASITPNLQVAAITATAFYGIFNLFSGFFIPLPKIPKWWSWYFWICPVSWTVYGLIVSQYGDVEDLIKVPGSGNQRIKDFIADYYGYNSSFLGPVAGVLVGFTVLFAFLFALGINTFNYQKR